MKRIFIADDSPNKLEDLVKSVRRLFPEVEISTFDCLGDFQRSVCHMREDDILREPDEYLMIFDMQMPFERDERIGAAAGIEALNILFRSDMQCPAVIVSSETLDDDLAKMAEDTYEHYKGFIRYSPFLDLTSALEDVINKH